MKREQTTFKCDTCGGEKSVQKFNESRVVFPYAEGWFYLYNLETQHIDKNPKHIMRTITKDNHFCSKRCFVEFIKKKLGME